MVENKDIAIIFNRIKEENGDEIFKPFKVVEGYFDEVEEWFIDKSGNTHSHICECVTSGNVYGYRQQISSLIAKYKNKTFDEIKKEILTFAKKYIYLRSADDMFKILMIDKTTNEEFIFKDIDTEEIYEKSNYYQEQFELSQLTTKELSSSTNYKESVNLNLTPKEIAAKVKETVKGQDEIIDTLVTTIYLNRKYPNLRKNNVLLIGPTGVGKTYICETLAKILNIPIIIFSSAGLSQAGYVGRGTEEILEQILIECNKNSELAKNAIVVLDELDKLAYTDIESGSVSTKGVQNELLKIIEGDKRSIRIGGFGQYTIDTSNIIFIGTGAFSEIYEKKHAPKKASIGFNSTTIDEETNKITNDDLVKYGLKRELLGRLPIILELNNLNKENLKDIIINSKESELNKIVNLLENLGINCSNIDKLIDIIATDALEKKIGARGLTSTINKVFMDIFYDVLSDNSNDSELTIGSNILTDKKDYTLTKHK